MESSTEQDYLKAIYKLSLNNQSVSTNSIADRLKTKASSATDMMQKLSDKNLVNYVKYQGVTLTENGKLIALNIVRKHRLWEFFLVNKLNFNWDEIHEIAEQLEHINSQKLIDKLDEHLGFPKFDPHGDPIPDKNGVIYKLDEVALNQLNINDEAVLVNVSEHSSEFLKYLENIPLLLGTKVKLLEKFAFDNSLKILINNNREMMISKQVAECLNVSKNTRHANLF
jgi:DtxR family Mn-dependent transcriptional regulator